MKVKLKSLVGSIYEFDIEKEKTINDLINIFYEKHKKKITKIVYKGRLLEKDKSIEECNYTDSDGLMIILFNKKISNNEEKKELKIEEVKDVEVSMDNYKESLIKYLECFSNDKSNEINLLKDEKLTDSQFLIDLLKEENKNENKIDNNINKYLSIFTDLNEDDYNEINEILKITGGDEEEVGILYLYCNKNKELVNKILKDI